MEIILKARTKKGWDLIHCPERECYVLHRSFMDGDDNDKPIEIHEYAMWTGGSDVIMSSTMNAPPPTGNGHDLPDGEFIDDLTIRETTKRLAKRANLSWCNGCGGLGGYCGCDNKDKPKSTDLSRNQVLEFFGMPTGVIPDEQNSCQK